MIENKMDSFINKTRPFRSDKNPKTINPTIKKIVGNDMVILADDTDIPNSSVSTGRRG